MPQSLLDTGAFLNGACGRPKGQGKILMSPLLAVNQSRNLLSRSNFSIDILYVYRHVMQSVNPFMAHRCGYTESDGGLMT
jgi:hypothetical protein